MRHALTANSTNRDIWHIEDYFLTGATEHLP